MNARTQTHQYLPARRLGHAPVWSNFLEAFRGLQPIATGLAAAAVGVAAGLVVIGLAQQLPATQIIHGLAALAAGIGLLMAVASGDDEVLLRGAFRAAVAGSAGIIAYGSLTADWGQLSLAYAVLLAWTMMNWISEGPRPVTVAVASGLTVATLFVLGQI